MRKIVLLAAVLSAVAAFAEVDVQIRATMSAGQPLPAYIALVAPDEPLWRPGQETFGAATFRVKPGAYKLFVGAPGHQDVIQSVVISEARELRVPLTPDVIVRGTVTDVEGKPIPGARVTQARLLGPMPFGQLSELAGKHLGARWATTSDAEGRWSLPGSVSGAVPLLIEASEFAPEFVRAANDRATDVVLRRGSSLRVATDRVEKDFVVSLIGEAASDWQMRAWAKSVDSTTLEWPSLPPGKYRVVGRYLDPRRFSAFVGRTEATAISPSTGCSVDDGSSRHATAPTRIRKPPTSLMVKLLSSWI